MLNARRIIAEWPAESREAAGLVIDQHGEPDEASESRLTWYAVPPWKRIVAQKAFWEHRFPAPHHDSVESFVDYRVPLDDVTPVTRFDGSVMVERTSGEVSARCHDEQANFLALNLMHDIVAGRRSVDEARRYYAEEFLNARRGRPTPYMEGLRFEPMADAADPDERLISDAEIEQAKREGNTAVPAG